MVRRQSDPVNRPAPTAALRASLWRRIISFYRRYNLDDWAGCYRHIDPRLRDQSKIEFPTYADSLGSFKERYGAIGIEHIRISLYPDARGKNADRPFAYAYVVWQDAKKDFHVFRERWVQDSGRWYTRVVGLVAHEKPGE